MLFNSYIFIFLFLPITVVLYFLAGKAEKPTLSKFVLLVASYTFIAYANPIYVLILLFSTAFNYICNRVIRARQVNTRSMLVVGVLFNILLLGYFKYTSFLIENDFLAFGRTISTLKIVLPVGISFYTFQQIAYLVDNYRGEVQDCDFLDYFLFAAYFPKVIQGPIAYHNELIPQFNSADKRKFDFNNFSAGLMILAIGLTKKVLIADNFGKIVDYGFGNISSLNSFEALMSILGYTLQIYFDFSGYCDMGIGISKMLNIELPVNFNSPYKALTINDFWKRWHFTLTRFLTKYIYIPLGGNRKGKARTYLNIMIVFIVSGIWHGAGYTFIVWGAIHGIASVLYRLTKKTFDSFPKIIQWAMTFVFVSIAWTFFRACSVADALSMFGRVFAGGFGVNAELTETMLQPTIINICSQILSFNTVMIVMFFASMVVVALSRNSNDMIIGFQPSFKNWVFTLALLVLSILSISGVSTFLYSNF